MNFENFKRFYEEATGKPYREAIQSQKIEQKGQENERLQKQGILSKQIK